MRFLEVVAGGLSVTDAAVGQTGNLCDSTSLSIGAAAVHAGGPEGSSSYSILTLWVVVVETLKDVITQQYLVLQPLNLERRVKDQFLQQS